MQLYKESATFLERIDRSPLIPAIRDPRYIPDALQAPGRVVYILCGAVASIAGLVTPFREAGKHSFVNVDLIEGLRSDAAAVAFLRDCGVAGVISTHTETLRAARSHGLMAIQRSFLLDSQAAATALRSLERFRPDAVELLPAPAAPYVIEQLSAKHPGVVPTAGGLIRSLAQIDELVRIGIRAVSVSDASLWIA
jgi:glycerol uptake operon antiterminator